MGWWDRLRGKPTRDDFATLFMGQLRARGVTDLDYDPERFMLRWGAGEGATYLGNLYHEYLATSRTRRQAFLERVVGVTHRTTPADRAPLSRDVVLERLLPRLRERSYYTVTIPLQASEMGEAMPARRFAHRLVAEHLALGLVQDFPEHIEEMASEQLLELGLDLDDAYQRATDNLESLSPLPFQPVAEGVFCSPYHDNHDASRIALTSTIRRLPVRGLPVVMAPHRDWLIVSGTDDDAGLASMAKLTVDLLDEPRFLSSIPVCLIDDVYAPFLPDPDSAVASLFAELRVRQLVGEYQHQRELLRRRHDEEIFVASFTGLSSNDGGGATSYCVWTRGVPSLLPHAEQVALLDPDGDHPEPLLAPWSVVVDHAGDLLSPEDCYPPRYRVEGFPDARAMAAIAAESTAAVSRSRGLV
ncbi:MAG: hypothetical protein R3B72_13020 [Polyangiaceae bacterium]